ncbi:MAG: hypothetical protein AAB614_02235, partial [Patescibacteria group bacterium]
MNNTLSKSLKNSLFNGYFPLLLAIFFIFSISSPSTVNAQTAPIAGTRIDYYAGSYPREVAFDNITNSIWVANSTSEGSLSKINIFT